MRVSISSVRSFDLRHQSEREKKMIFSLCNVITLETIYQKGNYIR